jgi:hypothetical protein
MQTSCQGSFELEVATQLPQLENERMKFSADQLSPVQGPTELIVTDKEDPLMFGGTPRAHVELTGQAILARPDNSQMRLVRF